MNISRHNKIKVFVEENEINEIAKINGLADVIIPTREIILKAKSHKIRTLFPKYFSIDELLVKRAKASIAANVKRTPTYFSEIILVKKIELIYAESAICNVNRNDKTYILLILVELILKVRMAYATLIYNITIMSKN